nr:glycosyltransferase [Kineosporia mesophila]
MAARWWARVRRVPVIASYRSTLATRRYTTGPVPLARRWFFQGADLVLTAGSASTRSVQEIGVPRAKIVEGFNTVDVARFAEAVNLRPDFAPTSGHHYLYVGQLIPRKNVDSLVHAFEAVRQPHDTLTLVGDGPEEDRLKTLASHLDLDSAVRFTGSLDGGDLVRAYASANTLVLPSKEEVWGLVVNEGLAAGLQVVVSNACGVTPSIQHMPGVISSEPEPQQLAIALRQSKDDWTGPLLDHPVTRHTPHELAAVVMKAVEQVAPVR